MALLGAAPVAASGCCLHGYPKATSFGSREAAVIPLVEPAGVRAHGLPTQVIDVHAHFFNASDVPVRGFVAECIGHSQEDPVLRRLIELAAPILEAIAGFAPTAGAELQQLRAFDRSIQGLSPAEASQRFATLIETDRTLAAGRLAKAINGTALERELLALKSSPAAPPRRGSLSATDIRSIVDETRRPSPRGRIRSLTASPSDVADGFIAFLVYMLSMRASNLETHHDAYASGPDAFGIDLVLGSLVDFDYWIDCPPRSAQDDQVALHARLAEGRPTYFKPLVAYNPWTDIKQKGAGLARVVRAINHLGFAGVKLYPPIGFKPAGNADHPPPTKKRHPDYDELDRVLKVFFDKCAEICAPVLAHAARSNGRDEFHDDFGGPPGWRALIDSYAADAGVATIDFGHFGGGTWMQDFALLMQDKYERRLFGDLSYRPELICPPIPDKPCLEGRYRLRQALDVTFKDGKTVADRVMFGTDWLMLSLVKGWPDYPALVLESLQAIASPDEVEKIFGLNAIRCFNLTT